MPSLIREMRADIQSHPLYREIALLQKHLLYNLSKADRFAYYYDDHESLDSKAQILENYGALVNITTTSVKRFNFTEDFVEYLLQS